jgi:hypothetical protein
MTYEHRTRAIGQWLQGVLRRYTPPTGMDNATLKEEMVFIVQDVNKNIPSQYDDKDIDMVLEKIDGHVRALHGARTWPTIKTFIQATKDGVKDHNQAIEVPSLSSATYSPDRSESIMIQRIKRGDPIPDYILNEDSPSRQRLIDSGKITDQDLQKYIAPAARMQ